LEAEECTEEGANETDEAEKEEEGQSPWQEMGTRRREIHPEKKGMTEAMTPTSEAEVSTGFGDDARERTYRKARGNRRHSRSKRTSASWWGW
jgi:hypothetical protein